MRNWMNVASSICIRRLIGMPVVAAAIALVAMSAPAMADNITVTNVEFTAAGDVAIQLNEPVSIYAGVGEINFQGTDTTTHTTFDQNVWCIDVYHEIGLGSGQNLPYVTVVGLTTDNDGHNLSTAQINEMSYLIIAGTQYMNANVNNTNASAAIQLALWTLEYNGSHGNAFNSDAPTAVQDLANYYIARAEFFSLAGAGCDGNTEACTWDQNIYQLEGQAGQQSFAGYWNGQGNVPSLIPEPGSLALFGTALLGLAIAVRRRRRQS